MILFIEIVTSMSQMLSLLQQLRGLSFLSNTLDHRTYALLIYLPSPNPRTILALSASRSRALLIIVLNSPSSVPTTSR